MKIMNNDFPQVFDFKYPYKSKPELNNQIGTQILTSLRSSLSAAGLRHTIDGGHTLATAHRPHAHEIVTIQCVQKRLRTVLAERQRHSELAVVGDGSAAGWWKMNNKNNYHDIRMQLEFLRIQKRSQQLNISQKHHSHLLKFKLS